MVEGTDSLRNGEYTMLEQECNGMPVWSRPCEGVTSGGEITNKCYIFQKSMDMHVAWSLSPGLCTNAWMTSCQLYSHIAKYACENHPKTQLALEQFDKVAGWPWEEKRWVNNWWETVQMSCIPKSGFCFI